MATIPLVILAGCSVKGSTPPTTYPSPETLQGQVFAGRNYMPGATVKIYATQPNGVPTKGAYVGKAKLLATTTSNPTGGWSVANLSCSSPDQLYVTAEGGIPYPSGSNISILGANPNSLMMTAIGDCSLLSSPGTNNITSIVTNEASTVAAVWALRGFISLDGTTVNVTSSATNYGGSGGIGVPGNYAGLAHAFLNANLLSPYKVGNFVQYTNGSADDTAGALVPVQELNSLAYMQYLCTIGGPSGNSGDFSYCTNPGYNPTPLIDITQPISSGSYPALYQLAKPPNGTLPTNSLQAMLDIAGNPSNNAQNLLLFSCVTPIPPRPLPTVAPNVLCPNVYPGQLPAQPSNGGVYVPYLTSLGTTLDWSVGLTFQPGYGETPTGQGSTVPEFVTVDANDDAFFTNPNNSTGTKGNVVALTSDGRSLWTTDTDPTLNQPRALAADMAGNVWVANGSSSGKTVWQLNAATGATIAKYTSTSTNLIGLAVDSLGNVWYAAGGTGGQNLHELLRSGSSYSEATFPIPPAATLPLGQIRPDKFNNIWVAGYSSTAAAAIMFPNTGSPSAPTYTAGLLYAPLIGSQPSVTGITTDANGNAYSVTAGTTGGVYQTTVTGTVGSPILTSAKVGTSTATTPESMDTDGSGAIWFLDHSSGTPLFQYIPPVGTIPAVTNAFYPCYIAATTTGTGTATSMNVPCSGNISTRYDLAIDSTGTVWIPSYGNGRIIEIIGLAAPTVPLRALGKAGVMP